MSLINILDDRVSVQRCIPIMLDCDRKLFVLIRVLIGQVGRDHWLAKWAFIKQAMSHMNKLGCDLVSRYIPTKFRHYPGRIAHMKSENGLAGQMID